MEISKKNANQLFLLACSRNMCNLMKFAFGKLEIFDLPKIKNEAFEKCCTCRKLKHDLTLRSRKLSISDSCKCAKWLYEKCMSLNDPVDIHIDGEYPFIQACKCSNVVLVKWLLEVGESTKHFVDVRINNDFPFKIACNSTFDEELPKILYLKSYEYANPIDIHTQNEYPFRVACKNCELGIAMWLYEIGETTGHPINIRICGDFAFRKACKYVCYYGDTFIAKWLTTLCDDYVFPSDYDMESDELPNWSIKNPANDLAKEMHNTLMAEIKLHDT